MERVATVDPFENLVAAIQEGRISDVKHWLQLCEQKQIDITTRKVDGGQFSVVGHVVVSKSDPEVLRILLKRKRGEIDVNFVEGRLPLLHLAAYVGNLEVVTLLCNSQGLNLDARLDLKDLTSCFPSPVAFRDELTAKEKAKTPFIFPDKQQNCVTARHCAAFAGHSEIVAELVRVISTKAQPMRMLNAVDDHLMTPLHYGVIRGDVCTVEELSSNSKVRVNYEEMDNSLPVLDMAYSLVHHTKDHDLVEEYKLIKSVLLERGDVQRYMEAVNKEKEKFLNFLRAMLVAASVISTTSRDQLESNLSHCLGSLSFCCAIVSALIATGSLLPRQETTPKGEVNRIHNSLDWTSCAFITSVLLLYSSLMAAGIKLAYSEDAMMIVVVVLEGCVALLGIAFYMTESVRSLLRTPCFRKCTDSALGLQSWGVHC